MQVSDGGGLSTGGLFKSLLSPEGDTIVRAMCL